MNHHAAVFGLSVRGHGGGRIDHRHLRADREGVVQPCQPCVAEYVDLRAALAPRGAGDHRPILSVFDGGLNREELQKIQTQPVLYLGKERRLLCRRAIKLPGEFDGPRDGVQLIPCLSQQPREILVGDPQLAFNIRDEDFVIIRRPA